MGNRSQDLHQDRKAEQPEIDRCREGDSWDYENIDSVSEELLGLHAFTGCDPASAFHVLGKVKPLQAMLKHDSVETFRLLEKEWEVSQELLDALQLISYFFYMATLFQEILQGNELMITKSAQRKLVRFHQIKEKLRGI